MGVNSLPKAVTQQCRGCNFNPGPFCAWVEHTNHSATEPPFIRMYNQAIVQTSDITSLMLLPGELSMRTINKWPCGYHCLALGENMTSVTKPETHIVHSVRISTPPEEDRTTAIGHSNMHRKFRKFWTRGFHYKRSQTEKYRHKKISTRLSIFRRSKVKILVQQWRLTSSLWTVWTLLQLLVRVRTDVVSRVEQAERDGVVFDEDIALTDAPQQTLECRQQRRQYHAGDEPVWVNESTYAEWTRTATYVRWQRGTAHIRCSNWSISPARKTQGSKPAARCCSRRMGQTDGRDRTVS